ncbi:hypothetical protein [Terrimonas alba]|uniref:hypothetical protein n=1 Tax=Terrimonas alba TaxID=3349636 RepID=UPI0035F46602
MRSLLLIALFAILSSCNGQTNHRRQTAFKSDSITSTRLTNSIKTTDGIVYFSTDNGLTWESKSEGLPGTVSLQLGAIAVSDNSLGLSTKENGVYLFDFQKNSWV